LCISQYEEFSNPKEGYCISLEGTTNTSNYAAASFFTVNEHNKAYDNNIAKFDYFAATLEPRYSYAEDEELMKRYCCEYYTLDSLIKFFYITNNKEYDGDKAKAHFEKIFSKDYALTYYLQMIVFG
jgi:hypothetical protein